MFKFLDRKNRKVGNSVETIELPVEKNPAPVGKDYRQEILDFINRNNFNTTSVLEYSRRCLSLLAREMEISQGAFYISVTENSKSYLKYLSGFASPDPDSRNDLLEQGEGFPGQVAKDGKLINMSDIPEGYLTIESGLGKASPSSLMIFPVKQGNKVLAVIELASFHKFTHDDEIFFNEISPSIAEQIVKNTRNN